MREMRALNLALAMALAATLAALPAAAQGKGSSRGDKQRTEQVRSRELRDRGDRWEDVRLERRDGRVPPGWCRGRGNPHGTPESCGSDGAGRVYRDGRYASSEEGHRAFHREHDQVCRERASQRPFDLRWQLQVRSECRSAHERWHDAYDPNRRY